MYNTEFDEIDDDVEEDMSIEDRHAEKIMNETTTLKNGHYEIGLPFQHNPPQLPDNLHTAEMRLKSLKSKMERNPDYRRKYSSVMEKDQVEGVAREVTDKELWVVSDVSKVAKSRQMLAHMFGAKSSPSVAGYALRRTAKDSANDYSSAAVDAVLRDFYVDDLLVFFRS